MSKWIMELPDDFEGMTEHEQDMNIELAYRKRKKAVECNPYRIGIDKDKVFMLGEKELDPMKPVRLWATEEE